MSRVVDAVVVTGFLGAGKTTLINRALAGAAGRRVAVLENEFGDVAVDDELLTGAVRVVALAGGCLCCTVQGELVAALEELAGRTDEFDLLVVETTGVADPRPVLAAFQGFAVRRRLRLRGVVTVVDAARLHPADEQLPEWRAQVRCASTIVLAKADAADRSRVDRLTARLRELHPAAAIVGADDPASAMALLAGVRGPGAGDEDAHDHDHDHAGHGFSSVAVSVQGDVDIVRVEAWLAEVARRRGTELLRVKGTLALQGRRDRAVVHGVRGGLVTEAGRPWGAGRRSRLVLIGRGLREDRLRAEFAACAVRAPSEATLAGR